MSTDHNNNSNNNNSNSNNATIVNHNSSNTAMIDGIALIRDEAEITGKSIPLLDLSNLLLVNNYSSSEEVTGEVRKACDLVGLAFRKIGFFVAAPNHNVKGLFEMEQAAKQLFALSNDKKRELDMNKNATFRGYTGMFSEVTDGKADFKASFDLGTDHVENKGVDTFMGANEYPSEEDIPGFKNACEVYYKEMRAFGRAVMRGLAVHLGLPIDAMTTKEDTPMENHLYRMLYYPPASPDAKERVQGIGAHTDYGALAMVVATGGGLEAMNTDGVYVAAPFIPFSIVVNAGDMIETWTNGLIKSTWHRVLHNNTFTRYSMPFFYEPAFDAVIAPLLENKNGGKTYSPIRYDDHVRTGTSKSFSRHPFAIRWRAVLAQREQQEKEEEKERLMNLNLNLNLNQEKVVMNDNQNQNAQEVGRNLSVDETDSDSETTAIVSCSSSREDLDTLAGTPLSRSPAISL